jgi:hypothetical protein
VTRWGELIPHDDEACDWEPCRCPCADCEEEDDEGDMLTEELV